MKTVINLHDQKISKPKNITEEKICNCIVAHNLQNHINIHQLKYQEKIYFDLSENTLKPWYSNQPKWKEFSECKIDTKLWSKVWFMKWKSPAKQQLSFKRWLQNVLLAAQCTNLNLKRCYLGLNGKLEIATYPGNNLLN